MKVKGSTFLYLLILAGICWRGYKLWLGADDCIQGISAAITGVLFIVYILVTAFHEDNDDMRFGKTFVSEYRDYRFIFFRFSLLHFIVFLINVLISKPFKAMAKWCDDKLSIGYENKR